MNNKILTGTFIGSAKGFGFVEFEDEGAEDIFIPPHFVCGALHGDRVELRLENDTRSERAQGETTHRGHRGRTRRSPAPPPDSADTPRRIGRITQILQRGMFAGTFFTEGAQAYVKPLEAKIPYFFAVPPKTRRRFALADGHRVLFSVDKQARPENALTSAFITEVLGHAHDPGVDVLTLVRQAGVPCEFPREVAEAAALVPTEVTADALTDAPARRDLRHLRICTIDGDDTKDIDDAVSLEITPEGHFRLGVHIADVAHYVTENSPFDREALRRGTSIYLADRVIPMLPHSLSSGICSLFPDVERLTVSCFMTVDAAGHVLDYEICESLIKSRRQWTYNEVEEMLQDVDENQPKDANEWLFLFQNLDRLRVILYEKRRARGALDFDLPEAKIRVDELGKPVSIEPYPRNRATRIIEECMILCNETVASHFLAKKIPFPYRTHEPPNARKLTQLAQAAGNYGIKIPPTANKPKILQKILDRAADTPWSYVISGAVLRALPQAHYTSDNPAHYGLASSAYCHFTSPIRRYADLQAHRIVKNFLQESPPIPRSYYKSLLPAVCAQASRTERAAEAVERGVAQLKKAQFMQGFEGQTFEGTVSGITPWGVYVMLPSTIEGMIPIENLRRVGLRYDKTRKCYLSKRSREALIPGTKLEVRLVSVDTEEGRIEFAV